MRSIMSKFWTIIKITEKIVVSGLYTIFRLAIGGLQLILLIFTMVMKIVLSIVKMREHI